MNAKVKVTNVALESDHDGYYLLFVGGKLVSCGDWYHDKITTWIDGYVTCLKKLMEVEEENLYFDYQTPNEDEDAAWYTNFQPSENCSLEEYVEQITDEGFVLVNKEHSSNG